MRVKKRYIVLCVVLCIVAAALSAGMFYFEMSLAHFTKHNDVISKSWHQTSKAEPWNGGIINTNFTATKVETVAEHNANIRSGDTPAKPYVYIGDVSVCSGKYVAYGQDVFGSSIVVYGDPRTDSDKEADIDASGKTRKFGFGSRFTVYYKPDNPKMCATRVNTLPYLLIIIGIFLLAVAMVVVCRILNNKLKENTFNDSIINVMDIPIVVTVAGIVLCFFIGMLIGTLSVGSDFTEINESVVAQYTDGSITI
ncbi:MAG: hypothetical protein J6I96_01425 [Oscillospiraceae bacterium]|nr:hypothetical protein [Oscillospiraceae bacterium]